MIQIGETVFDLSNPMVMGVIAASVIALLVLILLIMTVRRAGKSADAVQFVASQVERLSQDVNALGQGQQQLAGNVRTVSDAQANRATQALNETQELDRRMQTLTTGMDEHATQAGELFKQVDGLIAKTRAETQEAFVKMQSGVELMVDGAKAQMGGGNDHGGEGRGASGCKGRDKKGQQ